LPPRAWLEESLSFCSKGASSSDRAAYNASFFLSGLCRNAEAEQIWRDLRESKLVGELSRNALTGLGHAPPDPADAVVGIAKLVATPLTELRPGQRSMLAALNGTQCAQ
jgi:hypothetical protein